MKDNGGAAFPAGRFVSDVNGNEVGGGMDLRDWFAGQALGSIPLRQWGDPPPNDVFEKWASASYAVADAMLKERNK